MKNYKKDESMRDYLIRNGADIELVESPIVKEKLRNGRPYDIFKSRDFEDEMNITINEDGTFKFDENNLQSDPRDLNYHRIGNEYLDLSVLFAVFGYGYKFKVGYRSCSIKRPTRSLTVCRCKTLLAVG